MKYYAWNYEKNEILKTTRGVGFEQVVLHIQSGDLLDVLEHPNQTRYQGQQVLVVKMSEYVFLVPCIVSERECFLKTIIPSRKATRQYLGRKLDEKDKLK